jgi:tripartite-type tricarboxylate transporter receptor subunit TctC
VLLYFRGNSIMAYVHRHFFQIVRTAAAVILIISYSHVAWSQTTRAMKFVLPFSAGTSIDTLARLLAEQIGRTKGPTAVIESRPGAAGTIATEAVAGAAPDGNTLLMTPTAFVVTPQLRKLNYDPLTSFEPVCYLVSVPLVIAVNAGSPYRTLADLLNAARAKPGDVTLASIGPGSASQVAFEMLKRAANVDMTFISYPGTPPAVNALLGNQVTSVLVGYTEVSEQLNAGALRVLAVATRTRIVTLPEVPTVAESGYPGYEADIWYGVVAPAKTPKETIAQLAGMFTAAMQAPEVKAKLVAQGLFPAVMCGDDFGAFLRKQYDEFGRVIREAKIKVE